MWIPAEERIGKIEARHDENGVPGEAEALVEEGKAVAVGEEEDEDDDEDEEEDEEAEGLVEEVKAEFFWQALVGVERVGSEESGSPSGEKGPLTGRESVDEGEEDEDENEEDEEAAVTGCSVCFE